MKYLLLFSFIVCSTLISLSGCSKGKDVMLAPPSEPPEQILIPSPLPDANPPPIAVTDDEPITITTDDATDISPDESPAKQPVAPSVSSSASGTKLFHVCRSDDTPESVAKLYTLDIKAICTINGINANTRLKTGKRMLLPRDFSNLSSAPDITTYTVASGDTYSSIARQFGLSFEALMKVNGAADASLQIGDVLYVPKNTQ